MRLPATAKWIGLALLGLVIAAAVALAASHLASQQIGLASEPISAGDALAPAAQTSHRGRGPRRHGHQGEATTTAPTVPEPPTTTVPTAPTPPGEGIDDHGSSGSDGGGGGGDD